MWGFGVGLFLVNIASNSLQLPAIYGLSASITIFFMGAVIGDWVDNTPRLKAAVLSLGLQNAFVVLCAGGVYAFLWFEQEIKTGEESQWLLPLCQGGIILLAILAQLASLARQIAVERDWIVQICGKDTDMLATMTASLRRIDQGTLILAPIATGQVMTFAGLENGAIFIAAWNVGSWFLEYILMRKVYDTVPTLRTKKGLSQADAQPENKNQPEVDGEEEEEMNAENKEKQEERQIELSIVAKKKSANEGKDAPNSPQQKNSMFLAVDNVDDCGSSTDQLPPRDKKEKEQGPDKPVASTPPKRSAKCERFLSRILVLYRGWRTYMGYSVALAGIALACLYMTVLGFDNITVAYATTQGVSESILGILMGASAVLGILGTFGYPALRRRFGLVRTGLFALSCQVSCLVLCVVSVWMPGSPFDPLYYIRPPPEITVCSNITSYNFTNGQIENSTNSNIPTPSTSPPFIITGTVNGTNVTGCNVEASKGPDSYLSIGLLIGGIVLSRFGLWVADLTITQLFMEVVAEKERGIVSGVQSSLNKIMDVLKFVLVVTFPDIPTFGYLIIISFCFICLGWLFYAIFLRRARGHFFHFEKLTCGNGQTVSVTVDEEDPVEQRISEKQNGSVG